MQKLGSKKVYNNGPWAQTLLLIISRALVQKSVITLNSGPVAARNRIRLLLLGKEADIVVKTSSVQFDSETTNFTDDSAFLSQKVKYEIHLKSIK
jgi:hypothetical protein